MQVLEMRGECDVVQEVCGESPVWRRAAGAAPDAAESSSGWKEE